MPVLADNGLWSLILNLHKIVRGFMTKEEMIKKLNAKQTYKALADELGVTRAAVHAKAKRFGIKRKMTGRVKNEVRYESVVETKTPVWLFF